MPCGFLSVFYCTAKLNHCKWLTKKYCGDNSETSFNDNLQNNQLQFRYKAKKEMQERTI